MLTGYGRHHGLVAVVVLLATMTCDACGYPRKPHIAAWTPQVRIRANVTRQLTRRQSRIPNASTTQIERQGWDYSIGVEAMVAAPSESDAYLRFAERYDPAVEQQGFSGVDLPLGLSIHADPWDGDSDNAVGQSPLPFQGLP